MRRMLALSAIAAVAVSIGTGQPRKFGIGLTLGAPTGLSIKYWTNSREALQAYLGGGFGSVTFGGDYVFHSNALNNPDYPFYYGPGAFVGGGTSIGPRSLRNDLGLGVRFMFGIDYLFPRNPFDLAFELGPALFLSPGISLGLVGGVSFRFYP